MRSPRTGEPVTTLVFTEFGRMFFDHFAALLDRPELQIDRIIVSNHSAVATRRFLDRGLAGESLTQRLTRSRKLLRHRDRARWRTLRFLKRHRDRVGFYPGPARWDAIPCGYACSLGFMRRIPAAQLAVSQTTSNLHESLLPEHAGCAPVHWALRRGDPRLGVTLHELGENFDRGSVLAQAGFDLAPDDTALTVAPTLRRVGHRLLKDYLADPAAHHARAAPQPADAPPPNPNPAADDHRLDLAADADDAWARYRAAPRACVALQQGRPVHVTAACPPGTPQPGRRWRLQHGLWIRTRPAASPGNPS